jgi:hypothetical protein
VVVPRGGNITKVAVIDAKAMMNMVGNAELDAIAQEVNASPFARFRKSQSAAQLGTMLEGDRASGELTRLRLHGSFFRRRIVPHRLQE